VSNDTLLHKQKLCRSGSTQFEAGIDAGKMVRPGSLHVPVSGSLLAHANLEPIQFSGVSEVRAASADVAGARGVAHITFACRTAWRPPQPQSVVRPAFVARVWLVDGCSNS
jgi:hypothetical protein